MKKIGCIPLLIFIMFVLPGIGLLCGAKFYNSVWEAERDQCIETTRAVVSEIVGKRDNSEDGVMYLYYALVEYTVNDIKYSVEDCVGYGKENIPYSVGDRVTVHYNPDDPNNMYINEKEMSKVPTIFTIVGSILIGMGVLILGFLIFIIKKTNKVDSNNDLTTY